ncbi:hypothetical protein BGZ83_010115 [Gryganskiella cystojenkinii]|nr:hypothetical protein BGZ83_010115 [Gryganskiella cystojenkinii]
MNKSPLDIPEVLMLICQILKPKDQVVCMCVSRSFYDATAPYVWKSTFNRSHYRREGSHFLSGLRRNIHHIRKLYLRDSDEVAVIYQSISRDHWSSSQLESLTLSDIPVSDQVLAAILRHIHQLKDLNADGTGFGPLSFQTLIGTREIMQDGEGGKHAMGVGPRRLCDSIEELDICYCNDVTGNMVQTILENCPRLLRLYAERIYVSQIANGHEWVCTLLEVFNVHISAADVLHDDIPGRALHRAVHAQLARLTKLQFLVISDEDTKDEGQNPTLALRLESGLDQLRCLQDLRNVEFHCEGSSEMSVADAHWMADNWPALKSISGDIFNPVKGIAYEMQEVLEAKGIQASFGEPYYRGSRRGP